MKNLPEIVRSNPHLFCQACGLSRANPDYSHTGCVESNNGSADEALTPSGLAAAPNQRSADPSSSVASGFVGGQAVADEGTPDAPVLFPCDSCKGLFDEGDLHDCEMSYTTVCGGCRDRQERAAFGSAESPHCIDGPSEPCADCGATLQGVEVELGLEVCAFCRRGAFSCPSDCECEDCVESADAAESRRGDEQYDAKGDR